MSASEKPRAADLWFLLALVATSVAISWPILAGGYLTYVDNAVHLAEIHELARDAARGWSELSFTGFSLGTLHSPLWYPLLAALLKAGLPLPPIYATLLVAGFAAPPLVTYALARRRVAPFFAFLVAYAVMVQPALITGIGSPLGGMWTHALAVASVIGLCSLLARGRLSETERFRFTVLLAFTALTHLFAAVVAAIVVLVASLQQRRSLSRRDLIHRAADCAVAMVASAAYWLTFLLTTEAGEAPTDVLGPLGVFMRLLLPTDVVWLLNGEEQRALRWDLYFTDALPCGVLMAIGLGALRSQAVRRDPLARLGAALAAIIVGLLLLNAFVPIRLLGPVGWRLLPWVPIGLSFVVVSWVGSVGQRRVSGALQAGLALALAALGLWWGTPLRRDSDPGRVAEGLAEVRSLAGYLAKEFGSEPGRIYLQDTFGYEWPTGALTMTHLPIAVAQADARMRLVGTYYGVVPYRTRWTLSEFRTLFGKRDLSAEGLEELCYKTAVAVVVTSSRAAAELLREAPGFSEQHRVGRFVVFRRTTEAPAYVAPLRPSNHIEDVAFEAGAVSFELTTEHPRARVLVRTSYHPWWRVHGVPGAEVVQSPEGFLVVDRIGKGHFDVRLRYEPSRFPGFLTLAGAAYLLGWGAALLARRRGKTAAEL